METIYALLFALIASACVAELAYAGELDSSSLDQQGGDFLLSQQIEGESKAQNGRSLLACYYWYDRCDSQKCVCANVNNNNNDNNNGRKLKVVVVANPSGWWDSSENRCVCVDVNNNNNNNNNGK